MAGEVYTFQELLSNEIYKSWLRESSGSTETAYCIHCDETFSLTDDPKSDLECHAMSKEHIEAYTSGEPSEETGRKWLKELGVESFVYCVYCDKVIDIRAGREEALVKHEKKLSHISANLKDVPLSELFKGWLKWKNGGSSALCTYCNMTLRLDSSSKTISLIKHSMTAAHKMAENLDIPLSEICKDWMEMKEGDTSAFCRYCKKTLHNSRRAALLRHAAGKHHKMAEALAKETALECQAMSKEHMEAATLGDPSEDTGGKWLKELGVESFDYCVCCDKAIDIRAGREEALLKHEEDFYHIYAKLKDVPLSEIGKGWLKLENGESSALCTYCNRTLKLVMPKRRCLIKHAMSAAHKIAEGLVNGGNSVNMSKTLRKEDFSLVRKGAALGGTSKEKMCFICDFSCLRYDTLEEHFMKAHEGVNLYRCSVCKYETPQKYLFDDHMKVHLRKGAVLGETSKVKMCFICDFTCVRYDTFDEHFMKAHEGVNPYSCNVCKYETSQKNQFDNHMKVHLRFNCSKCNKTYSEESGLKYHYDTTHLGLKPFTCHLCAYKGSKRDSLYVHINNAHSYGKNNIGEKQLFFGQEIAGQKVVAKSRKRCVCSVCSTIFYNKYALKTHIESIHVKKILKGCQLCGKAFLSDGDLRLHIKSVHTKLKEFECKSCDFKTARPANLRAHTKVVHLGIYSYACEKCEKTFSTRCRLKYHIISKHSDTQPFQCEHCNFGTVSEHKLLKHTDRVHLKKKPFECSHCARKFALKGEMHSHIEAVHLRLKNHFCSECEYSCYQLSNMRGHIQRVHLKSK